MIGTNQKLKQSALFELIALDQALFAQGRSKLGILNCSPPFRAD